MYLIICLGGLSFLMKRIKAIIEDQKRNDNYLMLYRKKIIGSYVLSCGAVSKNFTKYNRVLRNVL